MPAVCKPVARWTLQETKYEEILVSPEHERHGDADVLGGHVHREQAQEVSPNRRRRRQVDWTAAATAAGLSLGGLDCRYRNSRPE